MSGPPLDIAELQSSRILEGRDEFNLAEFPLALLSDRAPGQVSVLHWDDEIVDKATHLPLRRRVTVAAGEPQGLPTAVDSDVLFAFLQLAKRTSNFSSRDLAFSRYEVLRILGWSDEGKSYRRLETSLRRWAGATITFSAWRDKAAEAWRTETFHVIDNLTIVSRQARRERLAASGTERGGGDPDPWASSLSWNRLLFDNLRAGYVSPIDHRLYFRLQSAVARRLYRYLSKHFRLRQQPELTFDLRTFAFEKVGLSRSYGDAGQIKKELRAGLEELEAAGFLRPAPKDGRYERIGPGVWRIRLSRSRGPGPPKEPGAPSPSNSTSTGPDPTATAEPPLLRRLRERGIGPFAAAELLREYPAPRVEAKLDVLDWLLARKDRRVSKNPAGFLADSIRKDYEAPPGYNPPRRGPAPTSPPPSASTPSPEREDQNRRQAAEAARTQRREAFLAGLDDDARERFVDDALRLANRFFLNQYHKHQGTTVESLYLDAILDDHLDRLAPSPPNPTAPKD